MKKIMNVKSDCRNMFPGEIISTIMNDRGIEDIEEFLNPTIEQHMLPLTDLKNIDKAVSIVLSGLQTGASFGVYADVDVDGICSTTIIVKYLKSLGINPTTYTNKGKEHGTSSYNVRKILEDKVNILIIVDSLDGNIDNYKLLHDNGVTIVVLDHHFIDPKIPYEDYATLVSSQNNYANANLCGSGVSWKFVAALDDSLGTCESYGLIDLAMAGTCGDMMDLSDKSMENRAIVAAGLSNIQNTTLLKLAKSTDFSSKTISFSVAPKINSAMRLSQNEYANNAFLSEDDKEINRYVKMLDACREEQKDEVARIYDDAVEQCNEQLDKKMMVVIIDSKYSINGLLGNSLMSIYQRPILVLTERFASYQGSMRACGVADFRQMLEDTGLCSAKGHELASGIEIPYNNFDALREIMEEKLANIEFSQTIEADAEINVDDVNSQLIDAVKSVDRISGMGFPSLKFLIEIDDFEVEKVSKGKHLCIRTKNMLFIKWNFNDDVLFEQLEDAALLGESIKCVGSLEGSFVYKVYNKMIIDDIILD